MNKKLVLGFLSLSINLAHANNSTSFITSATQAYSQNNLTALSTLAANNPDDNLATYLNANANLAKNNPAPSLDFIKNHQAGYLKNDLIHQLLSFYFNAQNWTAYLALYPQLASDQVSNNETCGYDMANFATNSQQASKSDFNYLIANKLPLWCISLIATKLNAGKLDKTNQAPFLYSLITNNQIAQFNQLGSVFKIDPIDSSSTTPTSNLSNPYQIVYRIENLSQKNPEQAYTELSTANVDRGTKQYLYNVVAADLASHQSFDLAAKAIQQGNSQYLSDDENEWRVRTYLAKNDWQNVLSSIKNMPNKLQNKNSWLYWKAYAAGKLGQKTTAQATLQKIPVDYSYYSLLAQAELNAPLNPSFHAEQGSIADMQYANDTQMSFAWYKNGKQLNNNTLVRLATQNLYYIISQSNDRDVATISRNAFNLGWNEMGIYAATKLDIADASLSFPVLFSPQYKQAAQQMGIEMTYPMAITRQESRFNPNALAFDGGVGLMQIMPATAAYIAKKMGSSNCYKTYSCNIQFGSWYLAHLMNKFGNNIIYASAGYNAGPGRAHRWQQAFQNMDNRIQVELIPFKITRDYVQKVTTNKLVYDSLINNSQPNMLAYLNKVNNKAQTFIVDDDNNSGDATGALSQN